MSIWQTSTSYNLQFVAALELGFKNILGFAEANVCRSILQSYHPYCISDLITLVT